jgi:hypothetical protein
MLKCNACGRVGDDIGTCGSHITCPRQGVQVEPTDVVLHCDLCDITRVISAGRIMQGKPLQSAHDCPQADCQCRPVLVQSPEAPASTAKGKARGQEQGKG